ncbi:hypothetical protein [Aquisphaera giovannonii]|uniref:hypothetical protein n=1 Tax=Aquisphaera giovannonii TaxID=406548 RepID=UPI0011DF9179|nr:hypothetical protein [Aquisphaera giovannonii]
MKTLKTTAEAYNLDGDVIRAYDEVLVLLKEYEAFLKEVVLYDLVADVARPTQKHFAIIAAGETTDFIGTTASGAGAGGAIGSFFPGVGTVLGGITGAGIGGAAAIGKTALNVILDWRDKVSNEAKDEAVKQAKYQHVEILAKNFAATRDNLQVLAKILGGREKYGWGSQVGFDGSLVQSFTNQLSLRPNDSFLHASIGTQSAEANPAAAARSLAKAAELVPQDFDAQADVFDLDRMELLLMAARVAEIGARRLGDRGHELAGLSASYYRQARDCVEKKDAGWPREIKVVYARACALAGEAQEANDTMDRLLKNSPDDPWLLYDYACVKSMMHEPSTPLYHLRRSFSILPRWQPYALEDSRLAFAVVRDKSVIERICANRLVGSWKDAKGLTLEFFEDGTMRQTSGYEVKDGNFEQVGDSIIKLNTKDTSKSYIYDVDDTRLKIEGGGKAYELSRVPAPLIGKWKYGYDEFEFRANGTWRRRRKDVLTSGTYLTISRRGDNSIELRCLQDNILKPEMEKRFKVRPDNGTLHVRVWNDSTDYDYERQ